MSYDEMKKEAWEHVKKPQVGDLFHEMFSCFVLVAYVDKDHVAAFHSRFVPDDIDGYKSQNFNGHYEWDLYGYTRKGFKKFMSYKHNKGTWAMLMENKYPVEITKKQVKTRKHFLPNRLYEKLMVKLSK